VAVEAVEKHKGVLENKFWHYYLSMWGNKCHIQRYSALFFHDRKKAHIDVAIWPQILCSRQNEYSDQSRQGIRINEDTPIRRHQDR